MNNTGEGKLFSSIIDRISKTVDSSDNPRHDNDHVLDEIKSPQMVGFKVQKHKWSYLTKYSLIYLSPVFLLIFVWIWIYVNVQSFVLMFWVLHGLNERNHKRYLEMMAKYYFPFLYIAMMTMYLTNIEGVLDKD